MQRIKTVEIHKIKSNFADNILFHLLECLSSLESWHRTSESAMFLERTGVWSPAAKPEGSQEPIQG